MAHRPASRISQFVGRRTLPVCGALAVSVMLAGCMKGLFMLGYIIGGPPSIEPDFEKQTKKSLTDYEVTVAVVCFAPKELKWDNTDVDKNIAKFLSYKLNLKKVKVISPDRVQDWLDNHTGWDTAAEIGAHFKTKYVIDIELNKYTLWEKGSHTLYRGQAEVSVTVWEMDEHGGGTKIYSHPIKSFWPLGAPRPSTDISYSNFRMRYLQRLSEEIGRLFYEHYNGADIGEVI